MQMTLRPMGGPLRRLSMTYSRDYLSASTTSQIGCSWTACSWTWTRESSYGELYVLLVDSIICPRPTIKTVQHKWRHLLRYVISVFSLIRFLWSVRTFNGRLHVASSRYVSCAVSVDLFQRLLCRPLSSAWSTAASTTETPHWLVFQSTFNVGWNQCWTRLPGWSTIFVGPTTSLILWPAFMALCTGAHQVGYKTALLTFRALRGEAPTIPVGGTGARCWRFISSVAAIFFYVAVDGATLSALHYRQPFILCCWSHNIESAACLPMPPLRHLFLNSSGNSKHLSSVSLILTTFNLCFHFFILVSKAFAINNTKNVDYTIL